MRAEEFTVAAAFPLARTVRKSVSCEGLLGQTRVRRATSRGQVGKKYELGHRTHTVPLAARASRGRPRGVPGGAGVRGGGRQRDAYEPTAVRRVAFFSILYSYRNDERRSEDGAEQRTKGSVALRPHRLTSLTAHVPNDDLHSQAPTVRQRQVFSPDTCALLRSPASTVDIPHEIRTITQDDASRPCCDRLS